jgi:putative FmdB family regulatory protein
MPTYEFRCQNGHLSEQFHRISDAPAAIACPTCGAEAGRAISGGAGLVFKGSGFYLTDYGKNAHRGNAPAAKSGEGGASDSGKSEGGKSESSKSEGGKSNSGGGESKPAAASTPSPSTGAPKASE